jgi:hypothetical protein
MDDPIEQNIEIEAIDDLIEENIEMEAIDNQLETNADEAMDDSEERAEAMFVKSLSLFEGRSDRQLVIEP